MCISRTTPVAHTPGTTKRFFAIVIGSTAMTLLTATAFAQGQAVSVVNGNFDSLVLSCEPGPTCFDLGVIPGWTGSGTTFKPSKPHPAASCVRTVVGAAYSRGP